MAKRKVIALDRQTPMDIALQEHGSAEALFTVLDDDGGVNDASAHLVPGQEMKVTSKALDGDVARFFGARMHKPVTGDIKPTFFCVGPGCFPVDFIEAGDAQITTTTGYVTMRQGGEVVVLGDGTGDVFFSHGTGPACLYSSDENGNASGDIMLLYLAASARWWSFKWLSALQHLQCNLGVVRRIDLRSNPSLEYVDIYAGTGAWRLLLRPANVITSLRCLFFGVDNTDAVINALDASIPMGELYLDGGAPRTSASETNYDALSGNGWTLTTP